MIEVTSRPLECTLLTPDYSQMPAVALLSSSIAVADGRDLVVCHFSFFVGFRDTSLRPKNKFKSNGVPLSNGRNSIVTATA